MGQGGRTYTPEKKFHYVYMLKIKTDTGDKFYIGKRSCNCEIEKDNYTGSGTVLKHAIRKYGKEALSRKIIEVCKTEEEVFTRETYYIKMFNAVKDPNFYNLIEGFESSQMGEGRRKQSEALRDKMTIPEHQKAILSDIHKRKVICINTLEVFNSMEEACSQYNVNLPHIAQCCRGQRLYTGTLKVTKEKLMWAYVYEDGSFDYPEAPIYDKHNVKEYAFRCLQTGKIYNTVKEASEDTGTNRNSIRDCCQGKQTGTLSNIDQSVLNWEYIVIDKPLPNGRSCKCINTQEIFNSLKEAGEKYNADPSAIAKVCNGKLRTTGKHPITGEKLNWEYVPKGDV